MGMICPRGHWCSHHWGRCSREPWPEHSRLRSVCHGNHGSQVELDLSGPFQARAFRDSVTSQPLGTAWCVATVPSHRCAPQSGQTSARTDVQRLCGVGTCCTEHHDWPGLFLAAAVLPAAAPGPSSRPIQPPWAGPGHLGPARQGAGAVGHGP